MAVTDQQSLLAPELLDRAIEEADCAARPAEPAAQGPASALLEPDADAPAAPPGRDETTGHAPAETPGATPASDAAEPEPRPPEASAEADAGGVPADPDTAAESEASVASESSDGGDSDADSDADPASDPVGPADEAAHTPGNQLLDDETAAELARIESMSPEEAAAVPDLEDGAAPLAEEDAAATAAPGPAGDAATSDESGDESLAEALAEIESMSEDEAARLPDLDDGAGSPEAAEAAAEESLADDPELAAALAEVEATLAAGDPTAADGSGGRKLQFKIGAKPAAGPVAAAASVDDPAVGLRLSGPWKTAYRVLDEALERINAPLHRCGERARRIVGACALVTLVMSALAWTTWPVLFPHVDAKTFIERKRAELAAAAAESPARPEAAEAAPAADADDGSAGPASDGQD